MPPCPVLGALRAQSLKAREAGAPLGRAPDETYEVGG